MVCGNGVGAQTFLFVFLDKPLQVFGRKAFIVDLMGTVHALDQRELIGNVDNLKMRRQIGIAVVRA